MPLVKRERIHISREGEAGEKPELQRTYYYTPKETTEKEHVKRMVKEYKYKKKMEKLEARARRQKEAEQKRREMKKKYPYLYKAQKREEKGTHHPQKRKKEYIVKGGVAYPVHRKKQQPKKEKPFRMEEFMKDFQDDIFGSKKKGKKQKGELESFTKEMFGL